MKKFESYEELLESIGVEFSSHVHYAKEKLNDYLSCEGSYEVEDKEDTPPVGFTLEIDNIEYEIGVTSIEIIPEEQYEYTYWLMDINLEGKEWVEVKETLEKFITIDEANWDNGSGIVDFKGVYSDFSIIGYEVAEDDVEIKDTEKVYRNN